MEKLPAKITPELPDKITPETIARGEAVKEIIMNDFQRALELIQEYQRALDILCSPDPNTVEARKLLNKYNMESLKSADGFKVFLDGRDITDFPDSLPGSVEDDDDTLQIESGDDGSI
jgi:hypothetical protein